MARLARLVVPGLPHHVTRRGNRRGTTVFEEGDYALYLDLLSDAAARARTEIWAYCLVPNHVQIILVPSDEDGLRRTVADLHRRYTGFVNARARTTGPLWRGRYGSVVMDEEHLFHAVRTVSLNPVRARLVGRARDWAPAFAGAGSGRASGRIWRARTTNLSGWRWCWSGAAWLKALEKRTRRPLAPGAEARQKGIE